MRVADSLNAKIQTKDVVTIDGNNAETVEEQFARLDNEIEGIKGKTVTTGVEDSGGTITFPAPAGTLIITGRSNVVATRGLFFVDMSGTINYLINATNLVLTASNNTVTIKSNNSTYVSVKIIY